MSVERGKSDKLQVPKDLFRDVKYYIIGRINENIQEMLSNGGAQQECYLSEMVTHAITDEPDADEVSEAKELFDVTVVKSLWVLMSVKCKCHLPTSAFVINRDSIFSGVVACPSQVTASDSRSLWAMITYHGGECQRVFNSHVTHLICTKAKGNKYNRAMQIDRQNICIVTPDWITDCLKEDKHLAEDIYHPRLLITTHPEPDPEPETELQPQLPIDSSDTPLPPIPNASLTPHQLDANQEMHDLPTAPPPNPVPASELDTLPPSSTTPSSISLPGMPSPTNRPQAPNELSLSSSFPNLPSNHPLSMAHRLDSHRAKEALARMVNNRMQGKTESPTETMPGALSTMLPGGRCPPIPPGPLPPTRMPVSPHHLQQPQLMHHQQQQGMPLQFPPNMAQQQNPKQMSSQLQVVYPQQRLHQQVMMHHQQQQHHQQAQQHLPGQMGMQPNMPPQPLSTQGPPMHPLHQQHQNITRQGPMQAGPGSSQGVGLNPLSGHVTSPGRLQPGMLNQQGQLNNNQAQLQARSMRGVMPQPAPHQHGPMQQTSPIQPPAPMTQLVPHLEQQNPLQPPGHMQHVGMSLASQMTNPKMVDRSPVLQNPMQQEHMLGEVPQQQPNLAASNTARTLQNITNRPEAKSPSRHKVGQLVGSLNQTPGQNLAACGTLNQKTALSTPVCLPTTGPQHEYKYYGHDPIETVPPEVCLLGCVFYITDYQKLMETAGLECWKKRIAEHGGIVDDSYSNRITHLLCENQKSDVFQMALSDNKRLVTAHWLNDVLIMKKMQPPWQALHLPSIYGDKKPGSNQILCITNFEGMDRVKVKHMILALGARYTGYMTHANSAVICERPGGTKYQRALEWRIPVVNVHWLTDLLLGKVDALKLPINIKYQQFTQGGNPFTVEQWRLAPLLEGWKTPLRVSKEAWKLFVPSMVLKSVEMKRKVEEQKLLEGPKRSRSEESCPPFNPDGAPVVLITGISKKQADHLSELVERLGGHVVQSARHSVTHLVAQGIARTVKFLSALSIVKHAVTPEWIKQSAMENKFLDEANFVLRDSRFESEMAFNLQHSLKQADDRKVFQDLIFYLTPSVVPSNRVLGEIIECAGGKVVPKRPSVRNILNHKGPKGEPTFFVVSVENDLHLCHDLLLRRIAVYNPEFVISSVLKQTLLQNEFTITMTPNNIR